MNPLPLFIGWDFRKIIEGGDQDFPVKIGGEVGGGGSSKKEGVSTAAFH